LPSASHRELKSHPEFRRRAQIAIDNPRWPVGEGSRLYILLVGFVARQAESELAALASQCLGRRIADRQKLKTEITAWEADRNKYHTTADWQFTTDDARIKLKHLYPTF
jgi:hypothetical protein